MSQATDNMSQATDNMSQATDNLETLVISLIPQSDSSNRYTSMIHRFSPPAYTYMKVYQDGPMTLTVMDAISISFQLLSIRMKRVG